MLKHVFFKICRAVAVDSWIMVAFNLGVYVRFRIYHRPIIVETLWFFVPLLSILALPILYEIVFPHHAPKKIKGWVIAAIIGLAIFLFTFD